MSRAGSPRATGFSSPAPHFEPGNPCPDPIRFHRSACRRAPRQAQQAAAHSQVRANPRWRVRSGAITSRELRSGADQLAPAEHDLFVEADFFEDEFDPGFAMATRVSRNSSPASKGRRALRSGTTPAHGAEDLLVFSLQGWLREVDIDLGARLQALVEPQAHAAQAEVETWLSLRRSDRALWWARGLTALGHTTHLEVAGHRIWRRCSSPVGPSGF